MFFFMQFQHQFMGFHGGDESNIIQSWHKATKMVASYHKEIQARASYHNGPATPGSSLFPKLVMACDTLQIKTQVLAG